LLKAENYFREKSYSQLSMRHSKLGQSHHECFPFVGASRRHVMTSTVAVPLTTKHLGVVHNL
jgi:hypothetical protein